MLPKWKWAWWISCFSCNRAHSYTKIVPSIVKQIYRGNDQYSETSEIVNPLSDHWRSNPLNFRQSTPQRPRGQISGVQQQGLAAFQQWWNLAESCFRKRAGSGVRKHNILSDYRMIRHLTLIAPSASEDWRSSSIFQSPDTVDSTFLSVA